MSEDGAVFTIPIQTLERAYQMYRGLICYRLKSSTISHDVLKYHHDAMRNAKTNPRRGSFLWLDYLLDSLFSFRALYIVLEFIFTLTFS